METFLKKYVNQNAIDKLPASVLNNLEALESDNKIPDSPAFQDIMKAYGPEIVDLIQRVSAHSWKTSGVWGSLKFVIDIAKEVYQMLQAIEAKIAPEGTPADTAQQRKIDFGVELVAFIWATVDPLKDKLTFLPFKKTLENWIVKKLARVGLEHAMTFFKANPKTFALEAKPIIFKAIE